MSLKRVKSIKLGIKKILFWLPEYIKELVEREGFSVKRACTSVPRSTVQGYLKKEEMKGKFFYTMGDTDFL